MPVTDIGSDWNANYRLPQGWTTLPDGSVGPASGLPDWLKQLIPSPGGVMPGGGALGYPAATPGGPSMGFPAQGGPQVMPPQNSTIPPNKSVGPFTGGASTENMAGGSAFDPRNWFKADPNATFQQGQPMNGPGGPAAGAGFNPMALLGNMNPYARAAIAGAGVMQPTATATAADQAPTNMWDQRPSGVGGMPGPQVTNPGQPHRPYSPTPQNYPSWPTPGPGGSSGTAGPTPTGSPSDTPRPGGSTPLPPRRPKNLGGQGQAPSAPTPVSNPRFGLYQSQVPGSGRGPLSSNPIYTTLNLANLFGGRS